MNIRSLGNTTVPTKYRRWSRWIVEFLIIISVIAGVRAWQHNGMASGTAPLFSTVGPQGQTINLETYRGEPVLLHFWATWCPICELEQDSISAIAQDWPVVTIAFQSGTNEEVQRYLQRRGMQHWTVGMDEAGVIARQYGVNAVPSAYILDGAGNIRFTEVGLTSSWGLRLRLWWASL